MRIQKYIAKFINAIRNLNSIFIGIFCNPKIKHLNFTQFISKLFYLFQNSYHTNKQNS